MKLAVTSSGKDLNSNIDPRFGRAEYFLLVDSDTMDFEAIDNKQVMNIPQGAGIQAAKTIADNKVEALITGNCGPKAFNALNKIGIKIYTGANGLVTDAINQFKNNQLKESNKPSVEGHWV